MITPALITAFQNFAYGSENRDYFFFDPHFRTLVIEELDASFFKRCLNLGKGGGAGADFPADRF